VAEAAQEPSCAKSGDVSPENDGSLKLEYDTGFGSLARKERTYEAVKVLRGTDRVLDPTDSERVVAQHQVELTAEEVLCSR
jgi:hypothetical protein